MVFDSSNSDKRPRAVRFYAAQARLLDIDVRAHASGLEDEGFRGQSIKWLSSLRSKVFPEAAALFNQTAYALRRELCPLTHNRELGDKIGGMSASRSNTINAELKLNWERILRERLGISNMQKVKSEN